MRKILLFAATALVMTNFSSCKEEPCKKNNTGDVIITNNTNETLWFDVTGNDELTTENRSLNPGLSTTYTIPKGTANIWASYINDNDYFMLVSSQSLAQCGVINFQTPSRTCELFQTTDITIINNTGEDKYFGVWIYDETQENEGFLLEDQYIASGKEYTYYDVYIGDGWASFEFKDGDTWYATNDDYEIYACKPFTFTWNAKKSNDKVVSKRRLERTSLTRVRKTKQ